MKLSSLCLQELSFSSGTHSVGLHHTLYVSRCTAVRKPGILLSNSLATLVLDYNGNDVYVALLFSDHILISIHARVNTSTTAEGYANQLAAISACVKGWPARPLFMGGDMNTGLGTPFENTVGPFCGNGTEHSAELLRFLLRHNVYALNSFHDWGCIRFPTGRQRGDPSRIDWLFVDLDTQLDEGQSFEISQTRTDHRLLRCSTSAMVKRRRRNARGRLPTGWPPNFLEIQQAAKQLLTADLPLVLLAPTMASIGTDLFEHGNNGIRNDQNNFDFHDTLRDMEAWITTEQCLGNEPSPSSLFHSFFRCDSYGCSIVVLRSCREYIRENMFNNGLLWKIFRYVNRRLARQRASNSSNLDDAYRSARRARKVNPIAMDMEHLGDTIKPGQWGPLLLQHYRAVYSGSAIAPPAPCGKNLPSVLARTGCRSSVDSLIFSHPSEAVRLKLNRRPGHDDCTFEVLMSFNPGQRDLLRSRALCDDVVPCTWKVFPASALAKPGKKSLTSNRLIVSLTATHKWYLKSLSIQLYEIVSHRLLPTFYGVRRGDNVLHIISYCALIMSKLTEWGLNGYLLKGDISKAFATVSHDELISACEFHGVPVGWCQVVSSEIRGNMLLIKFHGQTLGIVSMHRGLVEGAPCNPLLFGIWASFTIHKLLAHPQFVSSQLVLPAAVNNCSLRLAPVGFFDD